MSIRLIGGIAVRVDLVDGGRHRIFGTVDELGAPGRYRVRLFDCQSARCIRETWSDAETGAYSFDFVANRDYFVVAHDHGDLPLNASIRDRVTPTPMGAETPPAWDLPLLEGRVVSGQAVGPEGVPAELVSIRDWESKKTLANIQPDTDGNWTVNLPNGSYDISYFKDGCAPVCHGPYVIDEG